MPRERKLWCRYAAEGAVIHADQGEGQALNSQDTPTRLMSVTDKASLGPIAPAEIVRASAFGQQPFDMLSASTRC